MFVTLDGIAMDVMAVFPAKASAPIETTGLPSISAGITTSPDGATSGVPSVIGSPQIVSSQTPPPNDIPHFARRVCSLAASTTVPVWIVSSPSNQSRNTYPSWVGTGNAPYAASNVTLFETGSTNPPVASNRTVYSFGVQVAVNVWFVVTGTYVSEDTICPSSDQPLKEYPRRDKTGRLFP